MTRPPAALLAVVAAMWIGGCSGHDGPSTRSPDPRPPAAAGTAADAAVLPLDQLLGATNEPAELRRRWVAYRDGYPAAMTRCVREEGFSEFSEPVPDIPSDAELARAGADPGRLADLLDDHAYGLAENVELQIRNATAHGPRSEEHLPAWRDRLSPAEQAALVAVEQRCQTESLRRFPHPNEIDLEGSVYFEIQAIRHSIQGAPQMAELWRAWARCLSERGFHAPNRDELVKPMGERAAALVDRLDAAGRAGGVLEPDDPALLAVRRDLEPLAQEERETAAADAACARGLDLDRRLFDVQQRLEQAYIDEHGDELRSMLAGSLRP